MKISHILLTVSTKHRGLLMHHNIKSSHNNFKKKAKNTLYQGIDTKKKNKIVPKLSGLEQLSEQLHLPADIIAGAPIITATGQNEICLENYKGIIEFNGSLVKVQAKSCKICIEGKKLNILYFTEDEMRITGFIQSIYYR